MSTNDQIGRKLTPPPESKRNPAALIDGWTIQYNYFREHEGLRNRTPASVAGIQTDVKQWDDIARLDVGPVSHARSQHERKNPGKRERLEKEQEALGRQKKDGFETVKPGTFAGENGRKGLIGAPPSTKLWTGSKRQMVFTQE